MHLTEQLRKIPRRRIVPNTIIEPELEELPKKWRIFKRDGVIQRNHRKLTEFEEKTIAAITAYEEEAKLWRERGHFDRAGWLCLIAATKLSEIILARDDDAYSDDFKKLVIQAIRDFNNEIIDMKRNDPLVHLGLARCYVMIVDRERAVEANREFHEMRERMKMEPSLHSLVTINRLKKAILENSYEKEVNKNLILDLMGQIIDLTRPASVQIGPEERADFISNTIENWLVDEGMRIFGTESDGYKILAGMLESLKPNPRRQRFVVKPEERE